MSRIENPFSVGIRKPSTTTKQSTSDVYRYLMNKTNETSIDGIGEKLKIKMPESAKDYALYITLMNAL